MPKLAQQDPLELAQRLMHTLESIPDAFLTLDHDGRFTYVNSRAACMLGHPREALLGANLWQTFPELMGSTCQSECKRAMAQGVTVTFESFMAPWGRWLQVVAFPSAHGLAMHCRDVTEKHQASQRLLEEQETLSAVVNSTSNAIISIDEAGCIQMFNPAAERIFGYPRERMLGQPMEQLMPERFQSLHPLHRDHFLASGLTLHHMGMGLGLIKGLRADGVELDLEVSISQVTVQQQQVMIAILRDVTARVQADARVALSHQQLSDLTQRLMNQEKVLVKRLAQTLHDQLGQTLAAIRMAHETVLKLQKGPVAPGVVAVQTQIGQLITGAIQQIRQVLVDLRPPLLEEQGLAAALDNELRNRALTQPLVDISSSVPPALATQRWRSELEYAAFMVAREAVENALRHAHATSVAVQLSGDARALQLEVRDNGIGLPPGSIQRSGHLGILGMQERACAVGASVVLQPVEPHGACVRFDWQAAP